MHRRRTFMAGMLLALALVCHSRYSAGQETPQYDLNVSFDIPRSKVSGTAKISVVEGTPVTLHVGTLTVHSVGLNQRPIHHQVNDGRLRVIPTASGTLEIRYEGLFQPTKTSSSYRDSTIPSIISRDGISLTSSWYPQIEALANYRLTATLPLGYTAVSEAEKIHKSETNGRSIFTFEFEHPVDGINLIATDRYQVTEERFHGIELLAYFFAEDQALARKYLDYTKKYIELYEKLLLPFPFKRFAIVENFLPTGYSMPTYTLLGQEVVKLPFIVETSLGHEILHQWFGNQVYTRPGGGNWAEGLTTYLADHLYAEQKQEGWKYRKQVLIDYASYVRDNNDFPLSNFTQRFSGKSRAIGYGKAAMVFHMLRQMSADDVFFNALRSFIKNNKFRQASWNDLQRAFEAQLGSDLGWFFNQWVERSGLPELHAAGIAIERSRKARFVTFDLSQKGEVYRLDVQVTVTFKSGGEKKLRIRLEEEKKRVRVESDQEPAKIVIDADYDFARKLSDPETPPVIAALLENPKLIVVPPPRNASDYNTILETLRSRGAQVRSAESLNHADMQAASLLLLGASNPMIEKLRGSTEPAKSGFSISVQKNPWNPDQAVAMVVAQSAAEVDAAFPKIFHYGKYSELKFDDGRNVHKAVADTQRGIEKELKQEPAAIDLSTVNRLSNVIEKLLSKTIVYVGESHTKFSHHEVQLRVLQGLHRQNPKIAIGMEMFQRPSQSALDEYVRGAIDERTFLKRSEYFKRWDMDYNLYKPILDFARSEKIPVIALNLRREIVDKVGKSGLDSLTSEERREIPLDLDLSDDAYKTRLKEIFAAHANSPDKTFDFFYQAQILWDETMAESINQFLDRNPDFRVVVFAGSGHLQYGSGIPKRAYRRNKLDYAIVLSDAPIEEGIADFIVFPESSHTTTAPKLMVYLKEQDNALRITGFVPNSVSEKAGLKEEDALVALDGHAVENIADVKIALFFKKSGDTINVKIRRSGFLSGETEIEYPVKLQ